MAVPFRVDACCCCCSISFRCCSCICFFLACRKALTPLTFCIDDDELVGVLDRERRKSFSNRDSCGGDGLWWLALLVVFDDRNKGFGVVGGRGFKEEEEEVFAALTRRARSF